MDKLIWAKDFECREPITKVFIVPPLFTSVCEDNNFNYGEIVECTQRTFYAHLIIDPIKNLRYKVYIDKDTETVMDAFANTKTANLHLGIAELNTTISKYENLWFIKFYNYIKNIFSTT